MKIKYFYLVILCLSFCSLNLSAQGTAYSVKGGLAGSFAKWFGFQDNPLFAPHALIEIESFTEEDKSSLYASLGYYSHGSSTNIRSYLNSAGERIDVSGKFKVSNLGLVLGARGKKQLGEKSKGYYSIGIRGEYNISNNFARYLDQASLTRIYPDPAFLKKITYGVTAGGGIQFELNDRYDGILELNINPDISKQYEQPPLNNIVNPNPNGPSTINIGERSIRNLLITVTVGIRLVRYE